jgi:DNA-binding transcriptional LysR family regulator
VEIRQLEYFVAVADAGTFVGASQQLYVGQPAVSQQIGRLERELGVRLFDRSTRHVWLTSAGERLLPEARAALAAVDRVARVASDVSTGVDLVLRIGSSHGLGDRLYRILDELASTAPRLTVRLTRARLVERLAAVRSGELHAAFVRVLQSAPGLELVPVWQEQLLVALPQTHPLAGEKTLRLEQLAELPLRLAPEASNPAFRALITTALREAGVDPPAGPAFTTLQDTLAEIGTGPPSWTVFNAGPEQPTVRRVALRPLDGLTATTSLAALPGVPPPSLRLLLAACASTAG